MSSGSAGVGGSGVSRAWAQSFSGLLQPGGNTAHEKAVLRVSLLPATAGRAASDSKHLGTTQRLTLQPRTPTPILRQVALCPCSLPEMPLSLVALLPRPCVPVSPRSVPVLCCPHGTRTSHQHRGPRPAESARETCFKEQHGKKKSANLLRFS